MDYYRKRASPIGVVARDYLVELIKQEDVIHNKGTDGRIVMLKRQAWSRVAGKFNAAGYDTKKTDRQLMKIWERIKAKVRYEHAEHKREVQRSGGGVPPTAISEEAKKVLSITDGEMNRLDSKFDSDASPSDVRYDVASATELPSLDLSESVRGSSTTLLADEKPQCEVLVVDSLGDTQPYRDDTLQGHSEVIASTPNTSKQNCQQSRKRNRRFVHSQQSVDIIRRNKEQLAVLAEQCKVAQLQQEAEQMRIELYKEKMREHIANQEVSKRKLEVEDLKVQLLQEQLKKVRLENADLQIRLKLSNCTKEVFL